ncbi:MAG: homocysteine S-methyltransferase [Thalassobius sp.]|nr:homocysteine S-methyltransferase [Thalassovita sp.]
MSYTQFSYRPLKTRFITDGGLETSLIFKHGIELPYFAAFDLINNRNHKAILLNYYQQYIDLAKKYDTGFIFESPTWRANIDYGVKLGYNQLELFEINSKIINQMRRLSRQFAGHQKQIFVSGCIGPRYDAYNPAESMTPEIANNYHSLQIDAFKSSNADVATAMTMSNISEALGITQAAQREDLPVIISYTLETDGKLPSGESLEDAISLIDEITEAYPLYYMINCAHPTHFLHVLDPDESWTRRIMGVRANASCKCHSDLDECKTLDAGDKHDLAHQYIKLHEKLPNLMVYGGCCGTDISHIEAICQACLMKV